MKKRKSEVEIPLIKSKKFNVCRIDSYLIKIANESAPKVANINFDSKINLSLHNTIPDLNLEKKKFLNSGIPICLEKSKKLFNKGESAIFPIISSVGLCNSLSLYCNNMKRLQFKPDISPECERNNYNIYSSLNVKDSLINQNKIYSRELYTLKCVEESFDISNQQKHNLKKNVNWKANFKLLKEQNKDVGIWTEKYKPKKFQHLLHYTDNFMKLKFWLENHRQKKMPDNQKDSIVGNQFNAKNESNVAILIGPVGVGKTASVYAIAEELGYKVFELNSSHNRNGRSILNKFVEATQSHQLKTSIESEDIVDSEADLNLDIEQSLILIEDIDILFDGYDEGFINAIMQLVSITKRPVVLIANDECSELEKFQADIILTFSRPDKIQLVSWLNDLIIEESINFQYDKIEQLVIKNHFDIRKCIVELQWAANNCFITTPFLDCNTCYFLIPVDSLEIKISKIKLNILTTFDLINNITKVTGDSLCTKFHQNDSLNFTKVEEKFFRICEHGNSFQNNFCSFLITLLDYIEIDKGWKLYERKLMVQKKLDHLFSYSGLPPDLIVRNSTTKLDYITALKQINSTESNRLALFSKRSKRFSHYLDISGIKSVTIENCCTFLN